MQQFKQYQHKQELARLADQARYNARLQRQAKDDLAFLEALERQQLAYKLVPDPRLVLQKTLVLNYLLQRGGSEVNCVVCAGAAQTTWAAACSDPSRSRAHCSHHADYLHKTLKFDPTPPCVSCQKYYPVEKPLRRNEWMDRQEALVREQLAKHLAPTGQPFKADDQVRLAEFKVVALNEHLEAARKEVTIAKALQAATELELAAARQALLHAQEYQAGTRSDPPSITSQLGKRPRPETPESQEPRPEPRPKSSARITDPAQPELDSRQ